MSSNGNVYIKRIMSLILIQDGNGVLFMDAIAHYQHATVINASLCSYNGLWQKRKQTAHAMAQQSSESRLDPIKYFADQLKREMYRPVKMVSHPEDGNYLQVDKIIFNP